MSPGASLGNSEAGDAQAAVLGGSHGLTTEQDDGSSLAASKTAVGNRDTTADAHFDGSPALNDPAAPGRKRKSSDDTAELNHPVATDPRPALGVKKIRLTEAHAKPDTQSGLRSGSSPCLDKSLLPREIWHHVFTFCPPKSLGNLLAVNKLFNLYLDPASPVRRNVALSATPGALSPMAPNAIWQASRRLFWPQMPAPLRSKTELEMWRLACSPRCEECGRLHARGQTSSFDPHHPGPGTEGVAVIWAFGRRMCAACLLKTSDKELDLQISPSIPSAIIPALPFVFVTPNRDVFSATAFEQGQVPANLQVTKLFSKSDVEALQEEFLRVKDMGQGTVGEWLKGLPGRGSGLLHEASKWEKWASSGGVTRMRSLLYPGYERISSISLPRKPSTNPPLASLPIQGRHERTAEEAAELKAARKAEIERRALLLDPPMTTDILRHIPAFQAATQIVAQLDDNAWERLKPRLLAQRADAERILQGERHAESSFKQEPPEQQHLEATLAAEKEARDRIDKNWEEVQAPLRAKIAGYADEAVKDVWGTARKITRENCSRFAVDSLLYVRKRFYAEVAKDAAAARATGKPAPVDPPEGPFTLKLTLENMKWIFDTKIKPHTEPLRKELFYCNGCEGNFKTFGFEGVIQHYAAKHTGALSLGSIVVHWRAEWPEHPPFSAIPRPAKAPFHPHAPAGFPANGGVPLPVSYSYTPPAGTVPPPLPPAYPPPMGFGYTPPAYGDHYQQPPPPPPHPYQPQPVAPSYAPQTGYEQQPSHASPPAPYPAYQPPTMPYATPASETTPSYLPPPGGRYDYHYAPYPASNAGGPFAPSQPPTYPDLYRTKVEDIARNSREVWRMLGDIRDLPGNVRVFVTIHHLVKRFRSRFYETPPLSMFIDGLSNNKEMRPVRNVNGLVCKACHLGLGNAASVEQDRKEFSLPQLANHFQSKHVDPMQRTHPASAPLDWVVDMVLVPDLEVLPSLALSANEPQKALLSAAFPAAFAAPSTAPSHAQHQSYQHGQVSAEAVLTRAMGAREVSRTSSGHAGHPEAADSRGVGGRAESRIAGQSSHSTTPGLLSETDRSAHSDGVRHSPQGPQSHRAQNGFRHHKKGGGKNKRGKPHGGDSSAEQAFGKRSKTDDGRTSEMAGGRVLRAPSQADSPSTAPSSARPERHETGFVSQSRATTQPSPLSLHQLGKNTVPASANDEQESSILAALESHLEQRHWAQFRGQQGAQDSAAYSTNRDTAAPSVVRPSYESYTRPAHREGRVWSPSLPATRGRRSPGERQLDSLYHSRPATVERHVDMHAPQRSHAGLIEPSSRRAEDERFGLAAPRPGDRGHSAVPPEAGYRRYHDDMRSHSRPPVEAYEIVHVIDETGEYYIRRPVRHEPDPRYRYEDRRAGYDVGPNPALEPVYAHVSRSTLVREGVRAGAVPEGRPVDRRADPAYYEEYDPRFPAA